MEILIKSNSDVKFVTKYLMMEESWVDITPKSIKRHKFHIPTYQACHPCYKQFNKNLYKAYKNLKSKYKICLLKNK